MDSKAYKRCEFIIRQFMSVEKPPPELAALFHGWLLDGRNCREKNLVIRRLFDEAFSEPPPPRVGMNEDSASEYDFLKKVTLNTK